MEQTEPAVGAPLERQVRPGLMVRLFAWWRGGYVVWIQDHQGKVLATIAQPDAFGGNYCHVYWFWRIGRCQLLADGLVDQRSESSYVKLWRRA